MKTKYLLIVFLISLMMLILGAMMKVMSWPGANELLILGTAVQLISYILAIIKLLISKNPNLNN